MSVAQRVGSLILFPGSSPDVLPAAVAEDGPEDLIAGAQRSGDRAGDLGDSDAAAVGDRHLGDPEAMAQRLDLHLGGPAEVGVAHGEALEGVPAGGAEGAEIGVAVAIEEADEGAGDEIAGARLGEE